MKTIEEIATLLKKKIEEGTGGVSPAEAVICDAVANVVAIYDSSPKESDALRFFASFIEEAAKDLDTISI